jgi:hypothetical protein
MTNRVSLPTLLACLTLLALPTAAVAAEPCANEQLRAESNVNPATGQPYSSQLPDCRAYELVSPADTGGYPVASLDEQRINTPVQGAELAQITSGGTVFFVSRAVPAGTGAVPNGRSLAVFASKRTASGWVTTDRTAFSAIGDSDLIAGSADGSSVLFGTTVSLVPADQDNPFGEVLGQSAYWNAYDLYRIREGGEPQLVSQGDLPRVATPSNLNDGVNAPLDLSRPGLPFVFNQDLSAVGFTSSVPLTAAATAGHADCYAESTVGSGLAGLTNPDVGNNIKLTTQSNCALLGMTPDGRAIIQDTSGDEFNGVILVDSPTFPSSSISVYQLSGPTVGATTFNALSPDGSVAYVTTTDQLDPAHDTNATADLYTVRIPQFPEEPPKPPGPGSVTCVSCAVSSSVVTYVGQSADGSHVFFTTQGVEAGLWSWDGTTATRLTSATDVSQVVSSHTGNYVVGLTRQLAGNRNSTADVYRFAAGQSPKLITSGSSADTYTLSASSLELEQTPGLFSHGGVSDNGRRVVYDDSSGSGPEVIDEWVERQTGQIGQTGQISPTGSTHPYFVLATAGDLEDVFFLAHEPLVVQDLNAGTLDIYDARIGGGFLAPSEAANNNQTPNATAPATTPYTANLSSPSLQPAPLPADTSHPASMSAPKPLTRAQKLAKALKACKMEKPKSKRQSCEKAASKKYGAKSKTKTKAKKSANGKGRM